jgi:hypothetical protein
MPFLTDLGPQQPVTTTPSLVPGTLRRISVIDTHQAEPGGSDVTLRGRDVVARASSVEVLDQVELRAHLTDRVIDAIDIVDAIDDDRLTELTGNRVGPGFRSAVTRVVPADAARASLLHLLLDDWAGAALVSGYALMAQAATRGDEERLPVSVTDNLAPICAGFAQDAFMVTYAQSNGVIPTVLGPVAPALDALRDVEPLRPHGMRRHRRIDLWPGDADSAEFDAHFRDSHVDGDGIETIVHEYTVAGVVDVSARTVVSVDARVRVLPWQECPSAITSALRIRGMALSDLRHRIKGELVGTSTCTHLNDTLRCLGDLDALLEARLRLDDV